jgi:hypothetical protein
MPRFAKLIMVGCISTAMSACSIDAVRFSQGTVAVGGTVTGLVGAEALVLANNDGDELVISQDGPFTFPARLPHGAAYSVALTQQPPSLTQVCAVANGSGTAGDEDVTSVEVNCDPARYHLGGTVTGFAANKRVVLQVNGKDDLEISANGAFKFPATMAVGDSYVVTIKAQASGQRCTLAGATGVIGVVDVTNVRMVCAALGWSPSMFPIQVPNTIYGVGDLAFDGQGDLLVVVSNPARAIVRLDRVTGAQTPIATGIVPAEFVLGVAYRPANDMIYVASDSKILAVTPAGVVTPLASYVRLHAITIAPPSFGNFGGFIIAVTNQGPAGQVIAVNPADGVVTTITAAAGGASDLAFAPDGTLYISGNTSVRTVTAAGEVTPFVTTLSSADGIAITDDGTRMFIADSGTRMVRQITIPGGVVTDVGPASVNGGTYVGGIVAAPGNTLIVVTDTAGMTLVGLPY